jgi:hypothetical protein
LRFRPKLEIPFADPGDGFDADGTSTFGFWFGKIGFKQQISPSIQSPPRFGARNWPTNFAITPVSTDPISFARRKYHPAPLPYFDWICLGIFSNPNGKLS